MYGFQIGPSLHFIRNAAAAIAVAMLLSGGTVSAMADERDAAGTADAFFAALQAKDGEAASQLLAEDVLIFESGGAEHSRDEYAGHHMIGDMEFVSAMQREIAERQVFDAGDHAQVTTLSRLHGHFRERDIDINSTETMLLRHTGDGWRIVHVHWSSRANQEGP